MSLELVKFETVQKGLKELLDSAYSMTQNLKARITTPVLPDRTNIWEKSLDSKIMQVFGNVNQDNRYGFKIDHSYDLNHIINATINSDRSISISEDDYLKSQGTEFIIIPRKELTDAVEDYAIRQDKYERIRKKLNKGHYDAEELKKADGFKINNFLTPEEAKTHDGWLELAVGKNKANTEEYHKASELLKLYVNEAKKKKCFWSYSMNFRVDNIGDYYKILCLSLCDLGTGSQIVGQDGFSAPGRFLGG